MNSMDDFFKKRLSDLNEADDGWNVPSEEVWENVVPHLPKPKKKRRRFILLFIGLGLIMSAGLIYHYSVVGDLNNTKETRALVKEEIDTTNKKSSASNNTIANIERTSTANNINKNSEESNNSLQEEQLDKRQTGVITLGDLGEQYSSSTNTETNYKKSGLDNPLVFNFEIKETNFPERQLLIDKLENFTYSENGPTFNEPNPSKESNIPNLANPQKTSVLSYLSPLPTFALSSTKDHRPVDVLPSMAILESGFTPIPFHHEIGITHGLSAFSFVDEIMSSDLDDQFSIIPTYQNINFHYNKVISNRWRFSTGAFLSKLNMNIVFDESFVYESISSSRSIVTEYDDTVQQSSANGSGQVTINFVSGQEPQEAETLNIRGALDVELRALQIPIFLTHHWVKNRWGFLIGGGPTLELLGERQFNADFNVLRDENIISSSVDIQDYHDTYTGISIYGLTGMKYHFNNHINVGINLKINIQDPIFSTADVGMYYRW